MARKKKKKVVRRRSTQTVRRPQVKKFQARKKTVTAKPIQFKGRTKKLDVKVKRLQEIIQAQKEKREIQKEEGRARRSRARRRTLEDLEEKAAIFETKRRIARAKRPVVRQDSDRPEELTQTRKLNGFSIFGDDEDDDEGIGFDIF